MNTFIKLMITYFIEQQLSVAHEAAAKAVGQIEMNYAFNKFQHDIEIAKSLKTSFPEDTLNGAITEIKNLCNQLNIDMSKIDTLTESLKLFIIESLKDKGVMIR